MADPAHRNWRGYALQAAFALAGALVLAFVFVPLMSPGTDPVAANPQSQPTSAPAASKPGSGVGRPKPPAPWHSFLPGMFK